MPTRVGIEDYECWITVEGKDIEHYGAEFNEETKVVTCWIPSEENKHFEINGLKKHRKFDTVWVPTCDGTLFNGLIIDKEVVGPRHKHTVLSSDGTRRRFMFSRLELTDDDNFLEIISSKDIGEVKVAVSRCVLGSACEAIPLCFSGVKKIHERSKKATAHQIQLGQQVQSKAPEVLSIRRYQTMVTFVFRYRPLDMLQANEIAPRPMSPSEPEQPKSRNPSANTPARKRKASEVKREDFKVKKEESDEDLDPEEAEERRKEAELLAEVERIRSARDARKQIQPPKKKVKREIEPIFEPGEVIDLT